MKAACRRVEVPEANPLLFYETMLRLPNKSLLFVVFVLVVLVETSPRKILDLEVQSDSNRIGTCSSSCIVYEFSAAPGSLCAHIPHGSDASGVILHSSVDLPRPNLLKLKLQIKDVYAC